MTGQLHRVDVTVLPAGWNRVEPEIAGNWSPTLSPDGRHMAYVSDRGGAPAVWVQPVDSELTFRVDTGPEPVSAVAWSSGGGWLACRTAPGGAPRQEVWLVRPDGSDLHQVAGFGDDTADDMRWLPGRPVLALTENLTSAILIDVTAETRTVVARGDLLSLLDVDPAGRFALLRYGPRGAREIMLRDLSTGTEKPVTRGEKAVFSPGGGCVYALSQDGEFPALIRMAGDAVEVLASGGEVEDFTITADGRTAAVLFNVRGGESEAALIDLDHDGDRGPKPVSPLPGPVVGGLAWSFDAATLAFTAEGPGRPHGVWIWRRETGEMRAVSAAPASPEAVHPTLEVVTAHDGLTLTGWLFRPGTPGPHPTVLWFHGGPEAQERPGHGPLFQSLVARGIAVFAPNVRGSSGFGRAFVEADNGARRYDAIEDVRSCVTFLRESGIAGRVGIMGRSYGGYLTLAALTAFPDLFTVGVDICGMSDFDSFYRHTEPWIAAAAVSKYGHPVHDAGLLRDLSPLHRLDRLRAPLLIVHGENDSNVPVIEAERVVASLTERGHPHRYLFFPGEGHELLHRSARAEFLRVTLDWLSFYLTAE
ncbi:peptidase S9 [Actinoplanes campanulatus]|uniref:S9 family peptidase n=1 Tax=Actinoplanes campanulatus TaxID=113559 RepID=UPI00166F9DB7|nr:S9 family peptidase [Actinoplanes campanulatus]GGM98600.1 peptidase S9 [Actinoplanes campanulatus]GID34172.1 peptidase S9 [Actinoplanes campanulatus]